MQLSVVAGLTRQPGLTFQRNCCLAGTVYRQGRSLKLAGRFMALTGLDVVLIGFAGFVLFTSVPADFHMNSRLVSSFFADNVVVHSDSQLVSIHK